MKKREKGTENIFENIIAEKSPNLGKQRDIQAQEKDQDNPKQDQLKEDHIKTHCDLNGKI